MWSLFESIKRNWLKHIVAQTSSILILVATYGSVLLIILCIKNIENIFNSWGKVKELTIYLKKNESSENLDKITSYLKSHSWVENFSYQKSEKLVQDFKKRFSQFSSQKMSSENISEFFPPFFKVKLKESYDYLSSENELDYFSADIKKENSFISEVSYGKIWLDGYNKTIENIAIFGWFLASLIFLISLFVTSNVIKTILFFKKDEIEILEFIGATSLWIYAPHVLNVFFITVLSFFGALFVSTFFYEISYNFLSSMLPMDLMKNIQFIKLSDGLIYFLLILIISTAFAFLTLYNLLSFKNQKTIYLNGTPR